ncbi:Chemotaxis signal transduction protein [Hyphomicrobiales bacterium]|nr:Chemotaxis signal transduction protein [Hyphomicrobiales bacterium]CAH1697503.1 Chemotaxis signal transduction protein [Hyphomicrobiales bacterium]CAI0345691.1 chemotaxis-related protein WspD [Hyphomicrobiales bacterium]
MPAATDMTATDPTNGISECWREIGVRGDQSCPELETHLHCRNCPTHAQIARQLLDRPLPAGYREAWTRHFAGRAETGVEDAESDTVLIFRLGAEWLSLPASACREIAEPRPVHSLPHRRSGAVLGIVNVRGELLVCVSLPELLGIDATPLPQAGRRITAFRRLVVVGEEGRRSAFEVDEVHGLHAFDRSTLSAVPTTVGKAAASLVTGVIAWNDRSVGCLDGGRLVELIDRSIA